MAEQEECWTTHTHPQASATDRDGVKTLSRARVVLTENTVGKMAPLKIVSWNIGLRGLQQLCTSKETDTMPADVHGISRRMGFGSLSALLRHLDADIVCLQEIKCAALGAPERAIALAEGYDSFFALCRTHTPSTSFGRYAGTATFVKTHCRPHRAEEGVTGVFSCASSSVA